MILLFNNLVLSLSSIYLLCYLIFATLTKRFIKTVLITALIGVTSLFLVKYIGGYFNISLPINIYTLTLCGFTGLPGVVLMLLLNIIFI